LSIGRPRSSSDTGRVSLRYLVTTLVTAGVQKWSRVNGKWQMDYVLQNGLNIGVPYSVANYPAALNPATDGCRNIAGHVGRDGTVTIYAVTSTVSPEEHARDGE
jgi:hypothetical protein